MEADITGLMVEAKPGWEESMQLMKTTPADPSWEYIAGLIDGEGTIGIYKQESARYNHGINHCMILSIANTNKALLDAVQKKCAVGGVHKNHGCFSYQTSGVDAAKILEQVLPFLILKHKQAELGLEFAKTIHKDKKPLTDGEFEWRDKLEQASKTLNSHHGAAAFHNHFLVHVQPSDIVWDALTTEEQQRFLPKLQLICEFACYMAAGMWKGTKKYHTDSYSLEQWCAHLAGEGADQANYQMLLINKWREENPNDSLG